MAAKVTVAQRRGNRMAKSKRRVPAPGMSRDMVEFMINRYGTTDPTGRSSNRKHGKPSWLSEN